MAIESTIIPWDFYTYQAKAHTFANYTDKEIKDYNEELKFEDSGLEYPVIGLTEEAGEVAGKFAKIIRDKKGIITKEDRDEIIKELGDVLWMISEIAQRLDCSLQHVAHVNIEKLSSRLKRGKINGSGDNR